MSSKIAGLPACLKITLDLDLLASQRFLPREAWDGLPTPMLVGKRSAHELPLLNAIVAGFWRGGRIGDNRWPSHQGTEPSAPDVPRSPNLARSGEDLDATILRR